MPLGVQAYMHGYWMEMAMYKRIQAVVDPFAFERYRKEKYGSPCCAVTVAAVARSHRIPPRMRVQTHHGVTNVSPYKT